MQHASSVLLSLKWNFELMQGAGVTTVQADSSVQTDRFFPQIGKWLVIGSVPASLCGMWGDVTGKNKVDMGGCMK